MKSGAGLPEDGGDTVLPENSEGGAGASRWFAADEGGISLPSATGVFAVVDIGGT